MRTIWPSTIAALDAAELHLFLVQQALHLAHVGQFGPIVVPVLRRLGLRGEIIVYAHRPNLFAVRYVRAVLAHDIGTVAGLCGHGRRIRQVPLLNWHGY